VFQHSLLGAWSLELVDLEPGTLIYDNKEKILIRKWSVESNIFYTTGIYTTNKGRTVIKYYY
jgi:hypothetical protein